MTQSDTQSEIQAHLDELCGTQDFRSLGTPIRRLSRIANQTKPRSPTLFQILAKLGGVASARAIAMQQTTPMSVRTIRDRLKGWNQIQKLGGGFYKLDTHPSPNLHDWLVYNLADQKQSLNFVIAFITKNWPHPDPAAIKAWIFQDPGRVRHSRGEVWIHKGRRPDR